MKFKVMEFKRIPQACSNQQLRFRHLFVKIYLMFTYHFNSALESLVTVSKHEKAMIVDERSQERFIASECFHTVIKHAKRVAEKASQMNTINNCSVLMNNRCVLS